LPSLKILIATVNGYQMIIKAENLLVISPKNQRLVTFPSLLAGLSFTREKPLASSSTPKPLSSVSSLALSYLIFQSLSCWKVVVPSDPFKQAHDSTVQRLNWLMLVWACKH